MRGEESRNGPIPPKKHPIPQTALVQDLGMQVMALGQQIMRQNGLRTPQGRKIAILTA